MGNAKNIGNTMTHEKLIVHNILIQCKTLNIVLETSRQQKVILEQKEKIPNYKHKKQINCETVPKM